MNIRENLAGLSDEDLTRLVEEAGALLRERRTQQGSGEREGQDVNDPDHGAITTPTPH